MSLVDYGDDSEEEEEESQEKSFSLTNFLFGNVSENGVLESDYLDEEAKKHLQNLDKKDLNFLTKEIRDEKSESETANSANSSTFFSPKSSNDEKSDENDENPRFSPSAVDFSDFNEKIEDEDDYDQVEEPPSFTSQDPLPSRIDEESITSDIEINQPIKDPEESQGKIKDASDPVPDSLEKELEIAAKTAQLNFSSENDIKVETSVPEATSSAEISSAKNSDSEQKSHLNTPLASVLPPELANINVNDVFPDFKSDVVLRFSRLFGPGRPSSLPKRWTNFRKNAESFASADESGEFEDDDAVLEKLCQENWPIFSPKENSNQNLNQNQNQNQNSDSNSNLVEKKNSAVEVEPSVDDAPTPVEKEAEQPKRLTSAAIPPWRYGPAQYWYDLLNVDPTGENFDYGASLKKREARQVQSTLPFGKMNMKLDVNEEAFLMVSLTNWEDDVIWDGANFKREAEKILSEKRTAAGWLPNTTFRTAAAFLAQGKSSSGQAISMDLKNDSIFPAENDEWLSGNWEKDIIWDSDNIEDLPEPAILTLDPNDPNIVINMPEEEEYESPVIKEPVALSGKEAKEKKDMYKRSRIVLGKAGMLKEPLSPKALESEPKNQWKDPFNLSNDEYYSPRIDEGNLKTTTGAVALQHSIPAVQLYQYFFPTTWGLAKLRQFHRSALKKYSNGQIIHPGPHPVKSLNKIVRKKEKQREQERAASGGGEMFFMRIPEDLSVCDGEVILAEYSEEHPPLVSQVGMATRIKNYLKRKPGKNDEEMPHYDYGELTLAHTSPFLGTLGPGQNLQAFENNMFRAPIYQHKMPFTDFLVIRTRNYFFVRDIRVIFTVGQECPLIEVPAPNSKKATNFVRDYLTVHIYRLFWKSADTPRRIKTDDVKKLFAHSSESTVRKRLKMCAEFQRSGAESHWWNLKNDFRLPAEEEIRAIVTPEDYCAYHSMRSAEQRLKDAGYGEKLILATEDDGDEEQQSKMDDEIKAAPWKTTRAFIAAMKNKCILQLTGDADPTGRGEGFSYVKVANKIDKEKDGPAPAKRIVTGTDADLRKLSLNNAKNLLRKFGCNEEKIKKLTRWEIIALVRTLGGQQAKSGTEEPMSKFARGNRFSAAEQQEKYKEESQRIFELQNRILASDEVLSTDEESSEEEENSDLEELGRNLDSFIQSKKSSKELLFEREEEERKELKKLLNQEEAEAKNRESKLSSKAKPGEEPVEELPAPPTRKLRIVRTFRDASGGTFDRTEYVSRPALIDAYVRIRETKDVSFIQQFAALDSEKKEQIRKEKRRLQEQIRRVKRNESNPDAPLSPEPTVSTGKKKPAKEPAQLKVKCGACGQVGHMRTNKAVCPMAEETFTVAMTKEQEDQHFGSLTADSGLVKVEGAKITLRKEVLNQSEQIRRQSLIVKIPKLLTEGGPSEKSERKSVKKERREREEGDKPLGRPRKIRRTEALPDYLEKPKQGSARRRVDPVVSLASELEVILNELRELPKCELFRTPVSKKSCPDYALYVSEPMDLSSMRTKLNSGKYKSREDFLNDVNQIVLNSELYNGKNSDLTVEARKMLTTCLTRFGEREEVFKRLEKQINPLLDDDDQVALSYLFQQTIQNKLKTIEGSSLFHSPVSKKIANYFDIIKNPMDFETMEQKAKGHQYHTSSAFLADVELILKNCIEFNTSGSNFTRIAEEVVRVAREAIGAESERIAILETAIRNTQDAAETESVGTHVSDSESRTNQNWFGSRVGSRVGSVDDSDTRVTGGVLSDVGDDEPMPVHSPESGDVFNEDRQEEESFSRNSLSSPPFVKKQLRLSMGASYYEDAQTGYEDDQEPSGSQVVERVNDDSSGLPTLTRMSTLEDDLNVSDSDSDGEDTREKDATGTKQDDEDDGLWF